MRELKTRKRSSSDTSRKPFVLWNFIPPPFFGVVIGYCCFLFYLSSVSSFPVSAPFGFFDKIVHFCLYAGLSGIVAIGLQQARHKYSSKAFLAIPVGVAVVYGLTDEVHQLFIASRSFAVGDLIANATGAAAAAALLLFMRQRRKSGR